MPGKIAAVVYLDKLGSSQGEDCNPPHECQDAVARMRRPSSQPRPSNYQRSNTGSKRYSGGAC